MLKRYFTLEEAEHILPDIRQHLLKAAKYQKAFLILDEVEIIIDNPQEHALQQISKEKEKHHCCYHILKEIESIHRHGAIVKDILSGLIDFYALHEGKEVFLCWKAGEDHIEHWHDINTGFRERKPISLLKESRMG